MSDRDDDQEPVPPEVWEQIARELLRSEVSDRRFAVEEAFYEVEEALVHGDDVTPEHVRDLRTVLNEARERVECQLAPAAGLEPWGEPVPRIPMGVLWELSHHPKAGGEAGE